MNPIENFAKGTIPAGVAQAAVSMALDTGEGARFPQPSTDGSFYGTIWDWTDYADPSDDPDREIVLVTARATDTLTIVRAQQSTSDNNHNTGGKTYKFIAGITKGDYDEMRNKLDVDPTEEKSSTASKGGVFNGDFELGAGDSARTTNGWIEDEKYGWYFYRDATAVSAEFDTAISKSGKKSAKISTTDATGAAQIENIIPDAINIQNLSKYSIRIKQSIKYRLSCWVKTNNVATDSAYIRAIQYDSSAVIGTVSVSSKLTGNNDWTKLSIEFTSDADAEFLRITLNNAVAGNVSDAWFDEVKLEEIVEDTSFAGKVASRIKALFQAVTSTDNIDQNLDPTGAYADTYALTNAVNEGATHKQTFTPTKKHITQIGVWPVDKGSGNWTLVVHDSGNNQIAGINIANANLSNGAFNYFDVPFSWASGAYHFHVYSTVADGTLKSNTNNDLEDGSFIQRYAKKTESFKLIANGIKTELESDADGMSGESIIDLDNGKYKYDSGALTVANLMKFINNVFSASAGSRTDAPTAANPIVLGGWRGEESIVMIADTGATERTLVKKINTIVPIKHIRIISPIFGCHSANESKLQISADNVNWTDLIVKATAYTTTAETAETDLVNGLNVFYLRYYKDAAVNDYFKVGRLQIEADLDTSKIPQGLLYPIGEENRFTETVKMPSDVTRVYYRESKFDNGNGVLMPALELTDASANYIGHIPLRLDNSLETNPCVSIITGETTNGQQSGTGSADGSVGYILNDGEYMTLSSATDELKIVYKVGGGTTTFADITRNLILMSSDGDGDDSTQDPSHQQTVIIGTEEAGLLQIVRGMEEKIQAMKPGQDEEWKEYDPELTWTGGTPASITTVARYKIIGKICFFNIDISSADSNACSDLTIGLPAEAKSEGAQAAIVAHQLYGAGGATWAAIQGFIDDAGTSIEFRDFNTATDNQNVRVIATGFFEIS